MARKLREIFLEHNFYHIYNRGNGKRIIFHDDQDKSFFMRKTFEIFDNSSNNLLAICIMKNHFHLLIEAGYKNDISKLLQKLCTAYAVYYGWKYSYVGHIFQGRFKSKRICTELGILNVIDYIRKNPVKKGFSLVPGDYSWLWIKGSDPARVRPMEKMIQ